MPLMKLVVSSANSEDVENFVQFSKVEYSSGSALDTEAVAWRHLKSPGGSSRAVVGFHQEKQVARIWIQTNFWRFGGKELKISSPIDLLIHPNYRNIQNFMKVFRSGLAESFVQGDGVLHTSNLLTEDVYRKLLKMAPVAELDGAMFPTSPFHLLVTLVIPNFPVSGKSVDLLFQKTLSTLSRTWLSSLRFCAEPSVTVQEQIVENFHMEQVFSSRRNSEDRKWRYSGGGLFRYEVQWFESKGNPVGYIVWTDRDLHGIQGRFIVDLVVGEKLQRRDLVSLWMKVVAKSAIDKRQGLFFFYNRNCVKQSQTVAFPMLKVSRKHLPQRIPIYLHFREKVYDDKLSENLKSGYFVLADLDTF